MTLAEYQEKVKGLNCIKPFEKCCGHYMICTEVEPLDGRNTLQVDRSCIVECSECGGKFRSMYD